jgi:transcriptional regulator with XRE-family HTH domain
MINERIKELRTFLGLNQRDFSAKAKIGHSTLAMFETGKRIPKDIHISQICQAFNVNEEWLRNGTGEMLNENESVIDKIMSEFPNLDDVDRQVLEGFLSLGAEQRKAIKDYVNFIATKYSNDSEAKNEISATSEIDAEVESYRRELEEEKSTSTSEASRNSNGSVG